METALTERQTGLSRRGLLAGVAALSLGSGIPVTAGSTLAFDRFMAVSERLCDVQLFSRTLGERQYQIFGALRATEMRTLPMAASTAIILGTARMGADARTSVVDPESRSHDHKNLFIVGGANFPTSGVLPPTLTIAALAMRTAETIRRLL